MKAGNEVKVGAVSIAGIVVFLAIISFLGVFNFAGTSYAINIVYDQVNGLKAGNEVRFAGVTVGTVKDLEVVGNKIKVICKIDKDVKIPEDSKFSLGVDGVMGAKFVTIDPPADTFNSQMCVADQEVQGTPAQGLDEFMASSSKVLEKVEAIADAFNNVFGDPEVQKSMREGFLNARDISKN